MYNQLQLLAYKYFESFSHKDLKRLESLFDDEITLFDPIVKNVIGKNNVLNINKDIFDNCKNITICKQDIFIDVKKMIIIGEIEFNCDETKINVVDIIKINMDMKIESITAYLDTSSF